MKSTARTRARENLLISAVNAAIERGLITLGGDALHHNQNPEAEWPIKESTFEYELAGLPVIAHVR